jgi:hypothetical protein
VNLAGDFTRFGRLGTSPDEYLGMGWLRYGNADGWEPNIPLRYVAGLFYPIPDGMTQCSLTLTSPLTASVYELVGVPTPPPYVARRLAVAAISDTLAHALYTAPAARTDGNAPVRIKVGLANVGQANVRCTVYAAGGYQLIGHTLTPDEVFWWPADGWHALQGGEVVNIQLSAAVRVDVTVDGELATF